MLSSPDSTIRSIALSQLEAVIKRRIDRVPAHDRSRHHNGLLENKFGHDGRDIASLWTRTRNASRRLQRYIKISWFFSDNGTSISINDVKYNRDNAGWIMKCKIKDSYLAKLRAKSD